MINDNEDPTEMEYELEATTAFEVGTTSDPNPSKKKKGKMLEICPRGNNKMVIIIFPCS